MSDFSDVELFEYCDSYENLREKIIYEIIHQIRYNKFIRGDYQNSKFSFWQAIYNYDYFKENKQYPRKFTGYKTYLFDFYNIKDDPTARVKKVKNQTGYFIDTYNGFDFKNEVNKFCNMYCVKLDIYTINPFELPQIFKIGEVGQFTEVISLLVLPFREGLHFFLITDPNNVNGRLKSISYYNDLMQRKQLTAKELRSIPIKEFYDVALYEKLINELKNKLF